MARALSTLSPRRTEGLPVGRTDELRRIDDVLDAKQAALIAVTGPAASGKSIIVSACCRSARDRGYLVVSRDGHRGVPLRPQTDVKDFVGEVTGALSTADLGIALAAGSATLARLAEIVTTVASAVPVLIALDPFRPDRATEREIQRVFFRRLRRSGRPVVVVVAARRSLRDELDPDLAVAARSPEPGSVRRFLTRAAAGLEPPVSAQELEQYVVAAVRDPSLLDSLVALLPLARSDRVMDLDDPSSAP